MTGLLLGISFIIHIITLLSIIIVWKRSGAAEQEDFRAMKSEMEDILIAYTAEMKEENEVFLKELASLQKEKPVGDRDNKENAATEKPEKKGITEPTAAEQREISYSPPVSEEKETFGASVSSQILSMQKQGYSLDEIAKKVNKGKGEVELMLKFYRDGQ
ncbi:DUF6115 domain-containing protein [Pseudalkalibacillus salsuginis]|uniref:DUF6115 domain-containing protein n=1 Tax=Pseudalkalibacillus salsuginis TaxID=2910972 RepID=UPI001F25D97A|nr:hypothetical protein [Pseudalkalibacillus salsuginis]MCF6410595.1 hypothetical protein [Pseudalkalibacillus salsuginis]